LHKGHLARRPGAGHERLPSIVTTYILLGGSTPLIRTLS